MSQAISTQHPAVVLRSRYQQLRALLAQMDVGVRDVLRAKEPTYQQLGLGDAKWTDEQLLDFIGQYPILLQRPIVRTSRGTAMCRPSERVLRLLPAERVPPFTKEDGDVVVDDGERAGC